jgi:hypothetical protein
MHPVAYVLNKYRQPFKVNFTFILLSSSSSCFSLMFASDILVLTSLTTAIAKF